MADIPRPNLTEQTRARNPAETGFVERDGVKSYYEVYGSGEPTVLLLPTWSIVHSRIWKMQIPYLARHFRVVTFDGRGNGRSDRPTNAAAYDEAELAGDALAVLDATSTAHATVVTFSQGAQRGLLLANEHPDRVAGIVFIAPAFPVATDLSSDRDIHPWDQELQTDDGWAKYNKYFWRRDYQAFVEFFMSQVFTEPHSTKPIEDAVGWGLSTTAETLILTEESVQLDAQEGAGLARGLRCPVLVIQGEDDSVVPAKHGMELARLCRGQLVVMAGSGHAPHVRDPVKVNVALRDFVSRGEPRQKDQHWVRGRSRRKRALFISSPIGLGHAQRDVAIADELRKLRPDLEIDWLAQDPVTRVLATRNERIHPASRFLANESAHIEGESAEHDLHCFQAIRRMDEILLSNFMVFRDLVADEDYDLWIGDEAWELDYYLHENPEEKRAAYVWMTDFVGWLPMPDGGPREAALTADYNAEMIEHITRFPRVRDRAVFVGDPPDIVPLAFGHDLPSIRDWTKEHFDFSGYVTGFEPGEFTDRDRIRAELGYPPGAKVCIVTVGGSGVGEYLLRQVIAAFPAAKSLVPELHMLVVAGPRIDPATLPTYPALEIRAYVHELYRYLAACDVAVVQGGLTTSMELTAHRRPFLFFPLRHHFEQNFHVRHRLQRYRAGRCMDIVQDGPQEIAKAIAEELSADVKYEPVDGAGAARAARLIAEAL